MELDGSEDSASPPLSDRPRASALATAAAIVPGVALHGLGHLVAGETKTAYALMRWQAAGLALATASGLVLRYGGGTRYGNELTIPMLVSGSGLFLNSFIADVYGSASGGAAYRHTERSELSLSLGYAYIRDPQFAYKSFALTRAHVEIGAIEIDPVLWTALDANNQRARLPGQYTLASTDEGEYLKLGSAVTYHHFGDDSFSTFVGEISLAARIEMSRVGASLLGSFSTLSIGGGVQRTSYDIMGVDADISGLLLGHFGYGFYLPGAGELEAYYEHRRDNFTSGLSPSERNGSGFLGHFGLNLRQPLFGRFALQAQGEIGAALLLTAGLEISLEAPQ